MHILFAFEHFFRNLRWGRRNPLRALFYDLIRPMYVKDWDFNEDYVCMTCSKPVLKRYLFCCEECAQQAEDF